MTGPAGLRVQRYGERALLVDLPDLETVHGLYAALGAAPVAGVEEVVPAARTLLLRLTPGADPSTVRAALAGLTPLAPDPDRDDVVEIPVTYDGPDLAAVATWTGRSIDEVVAAHTGVELRVAFCGFAPGFGYLVGLPDWVQVPRRDDPRTAVPAGSVAVAGEFTGVYPRASPGGWRLLGRTDLRLWDLEQDPPSRLRPGTRVRFRRA